MSKKKYVFPALLTAIVVASVWFVQPVFAGLYKWTDETGRVHYTDDKSKIPKKYRTKTHLKKLRQLDDRAPSPTASTGLSDGGAGPVKGDGAGGETDKRILSEEEEKTVENTIAFFDSENARSEKYRGRPNYSPTYRSLQLGIEKNLPQKQKLIADLAKSKNPALKESHQFLIKSEAADKARLKAVWQDGYTGGYFGRVLSEIETKKALKEKLLAALEESKKLQEEKLREEQEKE